MQPKKILPSSPSIPYLQAFFVLLWSSGFVAIVAGLHYAEPFTFLFYRMLFAALLMFIIAKVTKAPWPKNWNVLKKIIITGLLTQFVYLGSYFYSLYYGVLPTVMAIILALQPLLTAVIYSLILKHKVGRAQYLGLFISFIGVIITVGHDLSTHLMTPFSLVIAIVCLCGITIGSIVQKGNPEMDLRSGSAIQFAVSIIPCFILSLVFGSAKLPLHPMFLISLAWLVIIISVTGNYLYYKLLKGGSAVKVNSLFYLMPAITAVLSYVIFGDPITIYILSGIILIVIGVLITQKAKI